MGSEIIKILKLIINTTKVSNYVYKPTGDRLSVLSTLELVENEEIAMLLKSRTITDYVNSLEIVGQAYARDAYGFLKTYEGRAVMRKILENSSFVNTNLDIDTYLDETLNLMAALASSEPR